MAETMVEKKWECRYCESVKRNDPDDPEYCSGKCRKNDGRDPLPHQLAEAKESREVIAMNKRTQDIRRAEAHLASLRSKEGPVVRNPIDPDTIDGQPEKLVISEPGEIIHYKEGSGVKLASLADYHACPEDYHRRLNPETLNWGVHLDMPQLKQAGLRVNRVPIPGDWDFEQEKDD